MNNNEPAFPLKDVSSYQFTGLSLRDYFAAAALTGFVARPGSINPPMDANFAYQLADAMLKERNK